MTDKDLYEGIARKDNNAFQFLYQNQLSMIRNMVVSKGGSETDAVDIFQEGIIALWMNIQNGKYVLQPSARISTYLYSICNNLWLKKLRSEQKITSVADVYEKVEEPHEEELLDAGHEQVSRLRSLFNQLGEKCRTILDLYYYQKSSMKEIAAALNYEPATAKNEKYRCMQKIRALYKDIEG